MRRRYLDSCLLLYSIMELICAVLYCFRLVLDTSLLLTCLSFQGKGKGGGIRDVSVSTTQGDIKSKWQNCTLEQQIYPLIRTMDFFAPK